MKKIVVGLLLAISLTACGQQEVSPPSCLNAIDALVEGHDLVAKGDFDGYQQWTIIYFADIENDVKECRSKAG